MVRELGTVAGHLLGRDVFPHTGTHIIILACAVVIFLVVGILLWYYSHPRRRKNQERLDRDDTSED